MSQVTVPIGARLSELVGPQRFVADPSALAPYEVDGLRPSSALRPGSAAEIADILRFAAAEHLAVIPMAGRTKLRIGMPPQKYDLALDLSEMNRVLAYDPRDLDVERRAGCALRRSRTSTCRARPVPTAGACVRGPRDARRDGRCGRGHAAALRLRHRAGLLAWSRVRDGGGNRLQERRPRGEKRYRLRSAQVPHRLAGHARGHHSPEFPHVPIAAGTPDVRGVIFRGASGAGFLRRDRQVAIAAPSSRYRRPARRAAFRRHDASAHTPRVLVCRGRGGRPSRRSRAPRRRPGSAGARKSRG